VAAFGGLQKFKMAAVAQGTKWPPNTKILRFGRNLVSKYIMMLQIDIHRWFAMVLGIG
jgi:hypothetical protein